MYQYEKLPAYSATPIPFWPIHMSSNCLLSMQCDQGDFTCGYGWHPICMAIGDPIKAAPKSALANQERCSTSIHKCLHASIATWDIAEPVQQTTGSSTVGQKKRQKFCKRECNCQIYAQTPLWSCVAMWVPLQCPVHQWNGEQVAWEAIIISEGWDPHTQFPKSTMNIFHVANIAPLWNLCHSMVYMRIYMHWWGRGFRVETHKVMKVTK